MPIKSYQQEYRSKLITAERAAGLVQSGYTVGLGDFAGRPADFQKALAKRKEELYGVDIHWASALRPDDMILADPTLEHFRCHAWFYGGYDRIMGDQGLIDFVPCQLGHKHYQHLMEDWPLDIYVQQVSPMDDNGCFHFGITNIESFELCLKSRVVVLETNENMPRIPGGTEEFIHISMVDFIIEGTSPPLPELPPAKEPSPVDQAMAELLLEEIPDRACLQLGIGSLPNLLGELICKSNLKDLGIHTEMFCDSMISLFEAGIVTGRYKNIDRCKMVFSFAMGSREAYNFMDGNPLLASYSTKYTNNPRTIALNDRVMSINNALSVDLFGQVCSESSGFRHISGTGGQLEFTQGSWYSKEGKGFLCLSSTYTDKSGQLKSRIVPSLPLGSIVTTPRTCVDYIVTEHGKARLKSRSAWERTELLIGLAHPDYRDDLLKEAEANQIWRRTNKIS